jgi:hypothetical protein
VFINKETPEIVAEYKCVLEFDLKLLIFCH